MVISWFSSSSVAITLCFIFLLNHDSLLSPLLHHTAKRGLSGFIFDGRPAYPWRRSTEFELAVGSVGVLSTRAGGGGGRRY